MKSSDKLTAWLEEQLPKLSPGARLPTDNQLAEMFGLSATTVRRTLKQYRDAGRLVRYRGKGTFVPSSGPPAAVSAPTSSSQNVAGHLRASICEGSLRRGQALPPPKQLVHAFEVSHATVRAAYEQLVRDGFAVKVGRRHWVGAFPEALGSGATGNMYLVARERSDFESIFRGDFLTQAYQKMERELLANGYALLFASIRELRDLIRQWQAHKSLPRGLVFHGMDDRRYAQIRPALDRLASVANRLGRPRPRVLLDWRLNTSPRRPHGTDVLCRGNLLTVRARAVAGYLVRQHHRCALFFGAPGQILPLGKERAELRHLDKDFAFHLAVLTASAKPGTRQAVLDEVRAVFDRNPVLARILGKYETVSQETVVAETVVVKDFSEAYETLPEASAWVFDKDSEAAVALAWAQRRQIRLAGNIAIVSYENNPEFYHLGLTCCCPDYEQIGYQMAHTLINDFPVAHTSRGFIKANALVVPRRT